MQLQGVRCFQDTGQLDFGQNCNVFVGRNNSGKTTLLRAILSLQGMGLDGSDIRAGFNETSWMKFSLIELPMSAPLTAGRPNQESFEINYSFRGNQPHSWGLPGIALGANQPLFPNDRPRHQFIIFSSRRKAQTFSHDITSTLQNQLNGTLSNLYARLDLLATGGHPKHNVFMSAVEEIVGLQITTKGTGSGKEGGYYFDEDTFISLEKMGEGVSEIVSLIVELCLEKNRVFILDEPETSIHPSGLRALMALVKESSARNQFLIATHSNIVVRELADFADSKIFNVYKDGELPTSGSKIEEVSKTPEARRSLLSELGYEFADFGLFEGWLFLEESSAETILRDVLIPLFAKSLQTRLRTFSSKGAGNLDKAVANFLQLTTFIHLQPVYENRLWIRADDDCAGQAAISKVRSTFSNLTSGAAKTFSKPDFERFYPNHFSARIEPTLEIQDKQLRKLEKAKLLDDVLNWSMANSEEAKVEWAISAAEPIDLLQQILAALETAPPA